MPKQRETGLVLDDTMNRYFTWYHKNNIMENNKKAAVTPDAAVKILKKHGMDISREEAELVLEYLYYLAQLTLRQQVNYENSRSIR